MRHPHADLIKEWAEDTSRVVQYFWNNQWNDWDRGSDPHFSPNCQWRFKPETKPDFVRYGCVWNNCGYGDPRTSTNIKLTFDGETRKLKSAEVIGE